MTSAIAASRATQNLRHIAASRRTHLIHMPMSDTCPVPPHVLAAMVSLLLFLGADAWVYLDAKRFSVEGNPVQMRIGTVIVDRPELWAAACIVLFVLFFPAYLVSRKN